MSTSEIRLSAGAQWVIARLPDSVFEEVKHLIENTIETELRRVGYRRDIREFFHEDGPATLERDL